MMSTTVMMAVGGEQAKTHPVPSSRGEGEESSFARSFGESAGLSEKMSAIHRMPDASKEPREENSDETYGVLGHVKAKTIGGQTLTESDKNKVEIGDAGKDANRNASVKADLLAHANSLGKGPSKTTAPDLGELQDVDEEMVDPVVVSQEGKNAASGKSAPTADNMEEPKKRSSVETIALPPEGTVSANSLSHERTFVGDRFLLSAGDLEPSARKGSLLTEKIQITSAVKKSSKVEVDKGGLKIIAMTESAAGIPGANITTEAQGAVLLSNHVPVSDEGRRSGEGATKMDGSGDASAVVGKLAERTPGTMYDAGRKTIAQTGKNAVDDAVQDGSSVASPVAPTGFGAEIAKVTEAAAAAGKDNGEKLSVAIAGAALVHASAGGDGIGSVTGIVAGVGVGHAAPDAAGTKLQAGGMNSHADTQTELGEQAGSGAVADEMSMSHRTLLTTPTTLEVGLANGTQGWLKIRAEMSDGGGVNASLLSDSPVGQAMLHRELPALTAYLQEERVVVNSVVVHPTANTEAKHSGGMEGGGQGQAQQSHRQGGQDGRHEDMETISRAAGDGRREYMDLNEVGEDRLALAGTYAGSGGWLNVRA
jgi:hypothetical protein